MPRLLVRSLSWSPFDTSSDWIVVTKQTPFRRLIVLELALGLSKNRSASLTEIPSNLQNVSARVPRSSGRDRLAARLAS